MCCNHALNATIVFIDELAKLQSELVKPIELSRAKNMLKSMMYMQLESRLVLCEDIARQFVTYGKRESPISISSKVIHRKTRHYLIRLVFLY